MHVTLNHSALFRSLGPAGAGQRQKEGIGEPLPVVAVEDSDSCPQSLIRLLLQACVFSSVLSKGSSLHLKTDHTLTLDPVSPGQSPVGGIHSQA